MIRKRNNSLITISLMLLFAPPLFAEEPTKPISAETSSVAPSPVVLEKGFSSIMFSQKTIEVIEQALLQYNEGGDMGEISTTQLVSEGNQAEKKRDAPNFFLGSIVYFSPKSWSIWINDKRIDANDKVPGVTILEVNKKHVRIEWETSFLKQYAQKVSRQLTLTNNEGVYVSHDGNIEANMNKRTLSFSLEPNQSFVTKFMQVKEGKILTMKAL